MKLVDKMKDENLGLAILYNFTKGYGHVPMNVYDIVLPLIYNDTFRNTMSKTQNIDVSLAKCKEEDELFYDHLVEQINKDKDMTNKALGICLLNRYLNFEFEDNEMKGIAMDSPILDLNEAKELGQYFAGHDYDSIMCNLKKNLSIVFLDSASLGDDMDLSPLYKYGRVSIYPRTAPDETLERIKDADIVLSNKCMLSADLLSQCDVKLICITATGTNNVDLDYCHDHGITVCNVSGYSTHSVAQHTFALLLSLYNQIFYYHNYVESEAYVSHDMFCHIGNTFAELHGKTWGIAGLGAIGKEVADIAKAFGCRVVYYSTSGKNVNADYQQVDFDTLLKESDVISIHAPLTENTKNLFNEEALSKMKSNAFLINVGRGGIVDEEALVNALNDNMIKGAALDVFEHEPMLKDDLLLQIKDPSKLIMTPHVAWATNEARERLFKDVCLNIEGFIKGQLRNVC